MPLLKRSPVRTEIPVQCCNAWTFSSTSPTGLCPQTGMPPSLPPLPREAYANILLICVEQQSCCKLLSSVSKLHCLAEACRPHQGWSYCLPSNPLGRSLTLPHFLLICRRMVISLNTERLRTARKLGWWLSSLCGRQTLLQFPFLCDILVWNIALNTTTRN